MCKKRTKDAFFTLDKKVGAFYALEEEVGAYCAPDKKSGCAFCT